MAASGSVAGEGAPAFAVPVVIWNYNPLKGNFKTGAVVGQKIFLDKKKDLATADQLPLSNVSAPKIMEFLQMKEQLMGTVVTGVPTVYTVGAGISTM